MEPRAAHTRLADRLRGFLEDSFLWSLPRKVQLSAFSAMLQACTWLLIGFVLLLIGPDTTGVEARSAYWLLGVSIGSAAVFLGLVIWGMRIEKRGGSGRAYLIVTSYAHGLLAGPALYMLGAFSGFSWLMITAMAVTSVIAFNELAAMRLIGSVVGTMVVLSIFGLYGLIPFEPILPAVSERPMTETRLLGLWSLHALAGLCALLQVGALATLLRDRELRYRRLSTVDPLTAIANRRHFLERLADEWNRAQRHGTTFVIAMLDLDHFKSVNDRFGHPVGDEVLRRVAQLLRESLRVHDQVARYGGEEFIILLPLSSDLGARAVMERCRRGIADLQLEAGNGNRFEITASAGIAPYPSPGVESPDDLLALADRALYEAKKNGRNRVVIHGRDEREMEAMAEVSEPEGRIAQ